MSSKTEIVFVVVAKGHTVFNILGVYADEQRANMVRSDNAELWLSCEIEPWVVDQSFPDFPALSKKLVKQETYEIGDEVFFDDGSSRGRGVISAIHRVRMSRQFRNVFKIDCAEGDVISLPLQKTVKGPSSLAMYADEIKGVVK